MQTPDSRSRESTFSQASQRPFGELSGQSITIGHLEVYNFPQSSETPWSVSSHSRSSCWPSRTTSCSSGPICRICHEGDSTESLLAPCNCMGTIALVHMSCLERWLSSTETDSCELCHYKFKTSRMPRPFWDFVCHWVRGPSNPTQQRSIIGDLVCFFLLTPIAVASVFLCLDGALQQFLEGSQMEAGCLLGLSSVLASIYIVWISITIRYYYRNYRHWQQNNQDVHIVPRNSPRPETRIPTSVMMCVNSVGPEETSTVVAPVHRTSEEVASPTDSVFSHTATNENTN